MDIQEPDRKYIPIFDELNAMGKEIVDASYKVHKNLGPKLLEKIYEVCLCYELSRKGMKSVRQVNIPIQYDGMVLMKDFD